MSLVNISTIPNPNKKTQIVSGCLFSEKKCDTFTGLDVFSADPSGFSR